MKQCLACGELFENFDCPACAARRRAEDDAWMDEMEAELRHEEEQRELERQAMEEHFRRHPHG